MAGGPARGPRRAVKELANKTSGNSSPTNNILLDTQATKLKQSGIAPARRATPNAARAAMTPIGASRRGKTVCRLM